MAIFTGFEIREGALDGQIVPLNKKQQSVLHAGGVLLIPYDRQLLEFNTMVVVPKRTPLPVEELGRHGDRLALFILCNEGHLHLESVFERK